jgi:hypothetical protein
MVSTHKVQMCWLGLDNEGCESQMRVVENNATAMCERSHRLEQKNKGKAKP